MNELIPLINSIQDITTTLAIPHLLDLPQIVVVGSQSSGKSSVLESIVGKDFLPRGSGIVTRRPLVLQLIPADSEWGEFLHRPEKFFDFEAIRTEIQNETDRLVGVNKGVSDVPINLKIFSPNVVSLTLVDLPGMTKNPVGDQPRNIEYLIKSMVLKYVQNPNSIIVAVSPANQDLQNSDALFLAREVDPEGNRTIGVITKVDIMDRGTNALNMLNGAELPLRLGYVGVVCRSQADINSNKPVAQQLVSEAEFFQSKPEYRVIAHRMGIGYLNKKLNKLLRNKIKEVAPTLKKKIRDKMKETEEELRNYGFEIAGNRQTQSVIVLGIIQDYVKAFNEIIQGQFIENATEKLQGGSKLYYIFFTWFQDQLSAFTCLDGLDDIDIRTAILNAGGNKPSLFISEHAFELLIKIQIEKLAQPCDCCLEIVLDELKEMSKAIYLPEFRRFIHFQEAIIDCIGQILQKNTEFTAQVLKKVLRISLGHLNLSHPEFIGGMGAVKKVEEDSKAKMMPQQIAKAPKPLSKKKKGRPFLNWLPFGGWRAEEEIQVNIKKSFRESIRAAEKPTEEEAKQTEVIKTLVDSYFTIIKKDIGDKVPKIIWTYLIQRVKHR